MADLLLANSGNALSMNVSLSGSNLWQTGGQTLPYSVTPEGAITLLNIDVNSTDPGEQLRTEAFQALLNHPGLYQAEFGKVQAGAMETAATVNEALDSQSDLATTFPDSDLGESLNMVARMIQARDDLGVNNQMFFIITGGWDTHSDQLNTHPALLANLSACLAAFNDATIELGIAEKVTAFTASDFGRTLTSNGDGTDHAWGSNQLVLGGSVAGQSIYGLFPDLALDAELDVGGGRLIPTTAVDQYGATLAQWYASFSPSELAEIFPNLGNFSSSNLEFML